MGKGTFVPVPLFVWELLSRRHQLQAENLHQPGLASDGRGAELLQRLGECEPALRAEDAQSKPDLST